MINWSSRLLQVIRAVLPNCKQSHRGRLGIAANAGKTFTNGYCNGDWYAFARESGKLTASRWASRLSMVKIIRALYRNNGGDLTACLRCGW